MRISYKVNINTILLSASNEKALTSDENSIIIRKADYNYKLFVMCYLIYFKKESKKLFIYCQNALERKRARKKVYNVIFIKI